MTKPSCSRLWQADAIEEGRLVGADRDSFERHAETCLACTGEKARLERIRRALTELPTLSSTPLERRRLRNRILERAYADGSSEPRPRGRRVTAIFVTVAAFAVAATLLIRPSSPPRATTTSAVLERAPTFEVEASSGSQWQKEEDGETIRHRLVRGRLVFHVAKREAGQRFIVELPDGELEVKGTRFVVEVDDAGTNFVRCSEGHVALRIDGREVQLFAGDAWARPAARPAATVDASSSPVIKRPEPARRAAVDASSSAGEDFVAAMAAFSDGDFARAEKSFLVFERRHPVDARVEDATYLRAVARARIGDREGARELAREYVRRYPNGLRRLEAEKLGSDPR